MWRVLVVRWSFWAALVAHYLLYWFLGLWLPYYIR